MTNRADRLRDVIRAPVVQVVTVDRGNHHMTQTEFLDGLRNPARFEYIQSVWFAGRHVAKGTAAGAGLAHDHHGGVALFPAFTDVWAGGFFAHGV